MTIDRDEHDDADTEVPEGADTTGQGLPEEQPAGMGIDAQDHPADDVVDDSEADDAPTTRPRRDGDAGQATGNPRAAGGQEDQ